mgnify:FL=1|jgi:murein L,D-transpeptidase YcbB/YkuD
MIGLPGAAGALPEELAAPARMDSRLANISGSSYALPAMAVTKGRPKLCLWVIMLAKQSARNVMPRHSPTLAHPPSGGSGKRHLRAICLALGLATAGGTALSAENLLWFSEGRPTANAARAAGLLASAPDDGLDANDYDAERLRNFIELAANGPLLPEHRITRLDQELSAATRRYLLDLRAGRVAPQQLGENYGYSMAKGFDPDSLLLSAIADNRLADAVAGARPPLAQYAELREALAHYRKLSANPAWLKALPLPADGKLTPGQPYANLRSLGERLVLLGDLPPGTVVAQRYEGNIVDGVKSFQERHGLTADGVIGKATLEQLNTAPLARVRQLELALERLRWTPLFQSTRTIAVNVPEFRLRAYELRDGRVEVKAAMNVITGNASKTRTPIFDAEMRFVEFSPYWNVPPSIARGETLPKLRRDPAYFEQQGFEFVGNDGRVVNGYSEANLEAVQRGQMRIRQRPGAKNALGDIKFVFPNSDNIYLHHTPTPQLFKRDRRDFSHGCIRVEAPVALAKFVLADEPDWTEERIVQAMTKGRSATLRLNEPIPVVITYITAIAEGGRIHFYPDIYGQDKALDNALRQRSQALQSSNPAKIGAESKD